MYDDYSDFDEDRAIDSQRILDDFNRKLDEGYYDDDYEDYDYDDDYAHVDIDGDYGDNLSDQYLEV